MNEQERTEIEEHYQEAPVLVSYEDMANPLRVGTVVAHRDEQFCVTWNDEEVGETWSDLRQIGWQRWTPSFAQPNDLGPSEVVVNDQRYVRNQEPSS